MKKGWLKKYQKGGAISPEDAAISKVLMERNRGKNFVDRAFSAGNIQQGSYGEGEGPYGYHVLPQMQSSVAAYPVLKRPDGYQSHRMSWEYGEKQFDDQYEKPGIKDLKPWGANQFQYLVYPEVVQDKTGNLISFENKQGKDPEGKGLKYAENTGQYISAPTAKIANMLSNKGYKKATGIPTYKNGGAVGNYWEELSKAKDGKKLTAKQQQQIVESYQPLPYQDIDPALLDMYKQTADVSNKFKDVQVNKKANEIYNRYNEQANAYLSRPEFKNSPLKGKHIAEAARKLYKDTGYEFPIELALSQGQMESGLGTNLKTKNNVWNVGNWDKDAKVTDFDSPSTSAYNYMKTMYNDYFDKGKKNPEQLLKKGLVNAEGKRYSSNPDYEKNVLNQMQVIRKRIPATSVQYKNGGGIEYTKDANKAASRSHIVPPKEPTAIEIWNRDHPEQHVGPAYQYSTPAEQKSHEYLRNKMYQQEAEERANREFSQKLAPGSELAQKILDAGTIAEAPGMVRGAAKWLGNQAASVIAKEAIPYTGGFPISTIKKTPGTTGMPTVTEITPLTKEQEILKSFGVNHRQLTNTEGATAFTSSPNTGLTYAKFEPTSSQTIGFGNKTKIPQTEFRNVPSNVKKNYKDILKLKQEIPHQVKNISKVDLKRMASDSKKIDELYKKGIEEQNTFVRGVTTNFDQLAHKSPNDFERAKKALEEAGINWKKNPKKVAEYMSTHIPGDVDEFGRMYLNDNEYGLYTSNSAETAEGYTYGDGYVVKVRRPLKFEGTDRSKWLSDNTFEMDKAPIYDLKTGHEIHPGTINNIKNAETQSSLFQDNLLHMSKPEDMNSEVLHKLNKNYGEEFKQKMMDKAKELRTAALKKKAASSSSNTLIKLSEEEKAAIDKRLEEYKYELFDPERLVEPYGTGRGRSVLKSDYNYDNPNDPYAHYIFIGKPGEKVFDAVDFNKITPDIWKNKSRLHTGEYTPGLSRRKYGGKLTKNWLQNY